jgi:hypothetical protein
MKNIIISVSFLFIIAIGGLIRLFNTIDIKEKSQSISVPTEMKIENWGPQETTKGVRFNVQPNGVSAIWVIASEMSKHPDTYVTFGNNEIKDISVSDNGLTFYVKDELIASRGAFEIAVIEGGTKKRTVIGTFTVK